MGKRKTLRNQNVWKEAQKRYQLSAAEVQMARELNLNPRKFPSYAGSRHEPWKLPLKTFILKIYQKQFGRSAPKMIPTAVTNLLGETSRKRSQTKPKKTGKTPPKEQTTFGVAVSRAKSLTNVKGEAEARLAYGKYLLGLGKTKIKWHRRGLQMLRLAKTLAATCEEKDLLSAIDRELSLVASKNSPTEILDTSQPVTTHPVLDSRSLQPTTPSCLISTARYGRADR